MANENVQLNGVDTALLNWDQVLQDIRAEYLDETHHLPWIIGFSGGKDSTVVAHGVFEARHCAMQEKFQGDSQITAK